jgi:cobalt-zinc-cadmium efflux system outer membrane protein
MHRAIAAICLIVLATTAMAEQTVLTEEMAIQIALARDVVQFRTEANLVQAQSRVLAAKARPNPNLIYDHETLNDIDLVEQKLMVTQKFDFSGRRSLNIEAADYHMEAAQLETEAWQSEYIFNIRQQYFTALYQQARKEAYAKTQRNIHLLNQAMNKRRKQGDVSVYDFQRVKTERAGIVAQASNAQVEFETALQSLRALLGRESETYQVLKAELAPKESLTLESLVSSLDEQPSLKYLKQQQEAFTLQQKAESRTFPDVTLGVGLRHEKIGDASDSGLMLSAAVPLQVFDRRQSKQAQAKAQTLLAQTEYQIAYEKAEARLIGLWQQDRQYQESARKFRNEAVSGTKDLIKIAETYYRAGEVGILELLDAYRGALDAELVALELEYKARIARIKLDQLTGAPVQ